MGVHGILFSTTKSTKGVLAPYKRPVHIGDILLSASTCENGYEEEEIEWLQRGIMSQKCLRSSERRKASRRCRHAEFLAR